MPKTAKRPAVVEQEHLDYLDGLRESGACNMFGASSYLVEEFDLDKKEARVVLQYWMDSFSE
jgi:hypothetical protein